MGGLEEDPLCVPIENDCVRLVAAGVGLHDALENCCPHIAMHREVHELESSMEISFAKRAQLMRLKQALPEILCQAGNQ